MGNIKQIKTNPKHSSNVFSVNPKTKESCWVALDFSNNIIAENIDPIIANKEAKKITENYILTFIPKAGVTYIF